MTAEHLDLPIPDLDGRPSKYEEYYAHTPEKIELIRGQLIDWDDSLEQRRPFLALLLTNVGLVEAVRLAPEASWREAPSAR